MTTPDAGVQANIRIIPASARFLFSWFRVTAPRNSIGMIAALALIGFTAVIAQVVLMRELIVVFHGNELALGLILAAWFFWTALGSSLLGRVICRVRNTRALTACLQGVVSFAFPLSIIAARFGRSAFQSIPGEILGPGPMLAASFIVLSLFCAVSGGLFAAGSRLYGEAAHSPAASATASVYLLEALGSGIGGILASLFLIRWFTPFQIAALLGLLNLVSAALLGIRTPRRRGVVVAAVLLAFAGGIFPFGAGRLEAWSLRILWKGFNLLATRNSVYGNLGVVATEGNRSLYENGLVMATAPDPAAAEEAVHYALLQHPSPQRLLLIGGGVNGSLEQALKHTSLSRVDYVELDPAILELARSHFPSEWKAAEADPRVHVHHADGRLYLKSDAPAFDVIIVNLPDPQTAQLNRFYTVEFFDEVSRKLRRDGIFSFRLTGAENYISPQLAEFLRCINKTLHAVFAEVVVLPGDPIHFFASSQAGSLTADPGQLMERLRARQIQTAYVREYYIPFRMTQDRLAELEAQISPRPDTPVNHDFAPIAYYFDIALWSARFVPGQRTWFQSLTRASFAGIALGLTLGLVVLTGLMSRIRAGMPRLRASAGFCVSAMGFTLIALEVLLLLGFQALYGYVYHQLAILTAGFMVGIALGTWRGLKPGSGAAGSSVGKTDARSLAALQGLAALSPILLVLLFQLLAVVHDPAGLWVVGQLVFPALALGCGFLGGCQFPLASRIYFPVSGVAVGRIGTLYALDLAGSCVGAVIVSIYFVPVFGFMKSALLIGLTNLAPAALAWISSSDSGPVIAKEKLTTDAPGAA